MQNRPMASPFFHLLAAAAFLASAASHAADSSAAAAALKILTQPAAEASPHAEQAAAAPARETITVQRSETLDQLVRRQWAGWPLKDEVLRRAIADLNPKTIPNAANNLLRRGSVLVLPNTEDLRRTLLQHYPAAGELVRIKVEHETEESQARQSPAAGPEKRRWVRFP